jgi:hypothetical protein
MTVRLHSPPIVRQALDQHDPEGRVLGPVHRRDQARDARGPFSWIERRALIRVLWSPAATNGTSLLIARPRSTPARPTSGDSPGGYPYAIASPQFTRH